MARAFSSIDRSSCVRTIALACLIAAAFVLGERPAHAQGRDGLVNGAVIGAAVGAGAGVAFTHAVRDSDLTFGQYMRSALIFGAIGAGAGIGIDALFDRASPVPGPARPRVFVAPAVWRGLKGVTVRWSW
jgi:hypothetical protein